MRSPLAAQAAQGLPITAVPSASSGGFDEILAPPPLIPPSPSATATLRAQSAGDPTDALATRTLPAHLTARGLAADEPVTSPSGTSWHPVPLDRSRSVASGAEDDTASLLTGTLRRPALHESDTLQMPETTVLLRDADPPTIIRTALPEPTPPPARRRAKRRRTAQALWNTTTRSSVAGLVVAIQLALVAIALAWRFGS